MSNEEAVSNEYVAYSQARHPARHRERVGLVALFYGLFAGPVAWAGNLMVTFALAVHSCFPAAWPQDHVIEGFWFSWWLILACFVITLGVCASAFWISFRNWSVTGQESEGHVHHLMEVGEGRTRYLSLIGMAFSTLFFAATVYGIIVLAIEPLCVH